MNAQKKIIFLLLPLFILIFGKSTFGQESFEFATAMPPEGNSIQAVNPSYFGEYNNPKTNSKFIFNEEGVFMVTIITSYITREQLRETSKYSIRNEYLFGVIANDSVPYILEDDKYYFGIKQKVCLNDQSSKGILKQVDANTYILNFLETSGYSPSLLKFSGKNLIVRHFNYPSDTKMFDVIKKTNKSKVKDYTLVLLSPTQKEWESLDKTVLFDAAISFNK